MTGFFVPDLALNSQRLTATSKPSPLAERFTDKVVVVSETSQNVAKNARRVITQRGRRNPIAPKSVSNRNGTTGP
jgi:hypothetical protein